MKLIVYVYISSIASVVEIFSCIECLTSMDCLFMTYTLFFFTYWFLRLFNQWYWHVIYHLFCTYFPILLVLQLCLYLTESKFTCCSQIAQFLWVFITQLESSFSIQYNKKLSPSSPRTLMLFFTTFKTDPSRIYFGVSNFILNGHPVVSILFVG